MRRALAAGLLALILAAPGVAPADGAGDIESARTLLVEAREALDKAQSGEARLAAIGRAITAQEAALAALRRALRTLAAEEGAIRQRVGSEERQLAEVLAALQSLSRAPRAAMLAHPAEPVDAARAASMMGDVTPVIRERMARLKRRLTRLVAIRQAEEEARSESRAALATLQDLRAESGRALQNRRRPATGRGRQLAAQAQAAANSAETLAELSAELGRLGRDGPRLGFESARGRLPLPVSGAVIAANGEPDPAGRPGAGWTIEAPAFAQVAAPWDGTVRYAGPLGQYGNVVVLEPETGYLMAIAGLGRIDRRVGEVVLAGEKLGDMGGPLPSSDEFLFQAATDDGLIGREKLYLELRRMGDPVDPADWFERQDM